MTLASTNPPVLLVEDDPALLEMLTALLRRLHLDIVTAPSFQVAKEYIDQFRISGLITDESLGDGSGMELAAYALERNPTIRVGVVSGADTETPVALSERVSFLAKPFSQDELRIFVEGFPRKIRPA